MTAFDRIPHGERISTMCLAVCDNTRAGQQNTQRKQELLVNNH